MVQITGKVHKNKGEEKHENVTNCVISYGKLSKDMLTMERQPLLSSTIFIHAVIAVSCMKVKTC